MNKSNVTDRMAYRPKFECPICKKLVTDENLINSIRKIEENDRTFMRVLILCRICRDSGI